MKGYEKYERAYFMPPVCSYEWVKKDYIDKAPRWCSVDLRDGNQALIEPMSLEEKLAYFQMLVDIGFKEIEVGFPASSETEYNFMRALIERNMIPDDVTVQVLTQAREHIIKKTFEAVKGAPHTVIHLYNSTSVAQREQVFKKSKEEIKKIAVDGAKLLKELADETDGNFTFQYSPESFPGTEVDYAVEVCNAVLDVWQPTETKKAIINIPTTVEISMPHVFATQIEYISKNLNYRDAVTLCIHPHNDRGSGISDAELGVLAGAERVEGTLFGNGERTGNVDIVTLAMNMFSHGVDPELDFSNMTEIREKYENFTRMRVHERQPYSGDLVFTAFSGSHQDAIAKGMTWREEKQTDKWSVPYLPLDPKDVGRAYESDVIRINSQSGKGGVSYILKQNFGVSLPEKMREEFGYLVKHISDEAHKELSPDYVYEILEENYITKQTLFQITECHFEQKDGIMADVELVYKNQPHHVKASGNGRLDAVSNAIKQYFGISYELSFYEEHALTNGSTSKAMTYIGITAEDKVYWGIGVNEDIVRSTLNALVAAVNKLPDFSQNIDETDERLVAMKNYVQINFKTVTVEEMAKHFNLSVPYISKYFKDKCGETITDYLQNIKMEKAKNYLKNSNMTIENIAYSIGYQNVEHFSRLFKKKYGVAPIQYRNEQ